MILQERDIEVLSSLARYFILNSRQIRELCFPDDSTGRITRRRLTKMMHQGYVRKRRVQVVSPGDGSTCPVYHLAKLGREFLAGHFDDDALLQKPIEPSQPQHVYHYVAVSETHRLFDEAIKLHSPLVTLTKWVNEDEFINPEETEKSNRNKLRMEFDGKIVCLPDAALLLNHKDHTAVLYLEQDRDTFFHERVAARKSPGFRRLLETRSHRQQFPETTLDFFFVLFIAPTRKRCDQLKMSFAKKNKDHDVQKVYRFGALTELTPENLLFEPMFSCCHHDDLVPLIKKLE